jgi:ABC-type sugar transport system ATPase subunit
MSVADDTARSSEADRALIHVELRHIGKRFGPAWVLDDIELAVRRGSVHAIVGENGAGKSTLGKIVAGVHRPDRGEIVVNGSATAYRSPRDAVRDGLTIVAQELSLVPARTVRENVLLGSESHRFGVVRDAEMERRYEEFNAQTGFQLAGDAKVGSLRLADQQKVEILRAVARSAQLIVMDEPTASLDLHEARQLLDVMHQLRRDGTTVIYVSHNLSEVLSIADEVTVLRNGRLVQSGPAAGQTHDTLIRAMIGRSLDSTFPPKPAVPAAETPVLEVRDLSSGFVRGVSFSVMPGEIVGFAGLVGSGRSEMAHALFGAESSTGSVLVDGQAVDVGSPRAAMRAGITLVPESRKDQGLVLSRSAIENITIAGIRRFAAGPFVRRGAERRRGLEMLASVDARGTSATAPVGALSGGNQQKVLLGKWLMLEPRVFIADEPTRGVDIAAKRSIYTLLHALAQKGMGVILISSELEEVIGMAHRIVVMNSGRVAGELTAEEANEEAILRLAFEGPGRVELSRTTTKETE